RAVCDPCRAAVGEHRDALSSRRDGQRRNGARPGRSQAAVGDLDTVHLFDDLLDGVRAGRLQLESFCRSVDAKNYLRFRVPFELDAVGQLNFLDPAGPGLFLDMAALEKPQSVQPGQVRQWSAVRR